MPYMNTGLRQKDHDEEIMAENEYIFHDDDDDNCPTGVGILFKKDKPAPNNLFSFLQVNRRHANCSN